MYAHLYIPDVVSVSTARSVSKQTDHIQGQSKSNKPLEFAGRQIFFSKPKLRVAI